MCKLRSIVAGLFAMLIGATCWAAACDGFTDVNSADTLYCSAVSYIKDRGVTLGCTGTTFCPNQYVTRLQMALFLQRMGMADPSNALGVHSTTIAGGVNNTSNAPGGASTVGGGDGNTASGNASTVAGGYQVTASGYGAFAGGGELNAATGDFSAIAGGFQNTAAGHESFAGGFNANANADHCFVWGDGSTANEVRCDAPNRFVVRSAGGIYMFTGGGDQASYTGVALAPGASAWSVGSDRNGKEEFSAIDADDVLRRVVELPISTWKWKNQDASIRHMGPMAQDFSAAFGLGETPRGISTVDADGVALAAIQGLNAKLEAVVAQQARALTEIKAQLAVLAAAH